MISFAKKPINIETIGLTIILFADICLYNEKWVYLFIAVSGLGIFGILFSILIHNQNLSYIRNHIRFGSHLRMHCL